MHPSVSSYQNTGVVTTLVGFEKICCNNVSLLLFKGYNVSLLLLKTGTKLNQERVSGTLLNDLSKTLDWILFDLFNNKLHARLLDSHIQHIGNAC